MICPTCGDDRLDCKDSRPTSSVNAIRRRRQCQGCGLRFTTHETIDGSYQMLSNHAVLTLAAERFALVVKDLEKELPR